MFVFRMVEIAIPNAPMADLSAQTGRHRQHSRIVAKAKQKRSNTGKTQTKSSSAKTKVKKEVVQQRTYTEEVVVKDARLNIYTGNPGYYNTVGDTVYFGTVSTLSDSTFLHSLHPVVPKTVKPYGFVGKERVFESQDWVLAFILILWIIFASVRVRFMEYLGQIFTSLVNFNAATRLFRQRGYKTMYGAVRLDLIFHLIVPLSVFQIARFYQVDLAGYPSIILFLALLLIVNLYFFIKMLLYKLVGSIAMLKEQSDESIFNIKLYYRALGLLLLPLVTVHAVLPVINFITIWVMAVLIVLMYLATVIRSIYLGYQKEISIFYLILYLCTLEILPLLLIFKLIIAP